jgi:hypothetical protein
LINIAGGGSQPTPIEQNEIGETFKELFGFDSAKLKRKIAKRYGIGMTRFEAGCHVAKSPAHILGIVLTTAAGPRNEHDKLLIDYRHMRRDLKNLGLTYEDCMVAEISPDSHSFVKRDGTIGQTIGHLWHLHGVWRFTDIQRAGELHSLLSPLWGKIHGSHIVNVKVIDDMKKYLDYVLKDSLKGYCDEKNWMRRLLMSENWLPKKYTEVQKRLWQWAVYHGAFWKEDDDFTEYHLGEYIPFVRHVMKDYLFRWCHGESLTLVMPGGLTLISGSSIVEMEEVKEDKPKKPKSKNINAN